MNARFISASFLATLLWNHAPAAQPNPDDQKWRGLAEIRVGIDQGDLRGDNHLALQAAVDYVSRLGGGTVRIGPGRYAMRNALQLRDHVRIIGQKETVLAACDGLRSALTVDGDCNERQITVREPEGFRVGDGIAVVDDRYQGGFEVTTATLTEHVEGGTFRISAPLYLDYLVTRHATVKLAFPVLGGWHVRDCLVEGITIEGNRERSQALDGCRGGGIYLFECDAVTFRDCRVRGYNGDGISFQVSRDVTVVGCEVEGNAGLGLHPGSGSQRPVVRGNRSWNNGQDGLFVCWRVKHGLFEDNELFDNGRFGISIGHKDTDNLFRGNRITSNDRAGVFFRNESEAMGAHRNVFEKNVILDNGQKSSEGVAIELRGHHHDVIFKGNTIGYSKKEAGTRHGILAEQGAKGLLAEENEFLNVSKRIARPAEKGGGAP